MTEDNGKRESPPRTLMQDVSWTFRGPTYSDRAAFGAALRQEQVRAYGAEADQLGTSVVLRVPKVRVRPEVWYADEDDPIAELTADDQEGFSAVELLFKVHNAFVGGLRGMDHKYFEGFALADDQEDGKPPLYELELGS